MNEAQQIEHSRTVESAEMNLFSMLRPRIFMDGDQWCVLYGENLQDGVAGFGSSPMLAVYDFNKAWHRPIAAISKATGGQA